MEILKLVISWRKILFPNQNYKHTTRRLTVPFWNVWVGFGTQVFPILFGNIKILIMFRVKNHTNTFPTRNSYFSFGCNNVFLWYFIPRKRFLMSLLELFHPCVAKICIVKRREMFWLIIWEIYIRVIKSTRIITISSDGREKGGRGKNNFIIS